MDMNRDMDRDREKDRDADRDRDMVNEIFTVSTMSHKKRLPNTV
jgi:hypothetical protein